jgi:DNA-binding Lrp family transcriptional regulator
MVKLISFFKVQLGYLKSIIESLKNISEVIKVQTVNGEYDLLVEVEVEQPSELYDFFTQKIDVLEGLKDTNSHLILATWEK